MAWYQWTTQTLTMEIDSEALKDYRQIILSVKSGSVKKNLILDETHRDIVINDEGNAIIWELRQEDTALFKTEMDMQINILYQSGERNATEHFKFKFDKNLYEQLMPYEGGGITYADSE